MIKKIIQKLINRETILYLVFGGLTTIVNWIVYRVCDNWFAKEGAIAVTSENAFSEAIQTFLDKGTAGIIAWAAAVAFAYVTNRQFVFEERAHGAKAILGECGKFLGARVLTGVIEILGVPLLVVLGLKAQIFGLDVAKLIFAVVVIVLNYIFSKLFIFKNKDAKKEEECSKSME